MTEFYTHYWMRSNNTDWCKLPFTEEQGFNRGYIMNDKGYTETHAQNLVNGWNIVSKSWGYQYSLTDPTSSV